MCHTLGHRRAGVASRYVNAANRVAALRRVRDDVLTYCDALSDDEWQLPSRAGGWRVADVVAHLGALPHLSLTLISVRVMRTRGVERFNDDVVAARAGWPRDRVMAEVRTWSGRYASVAAVVGRTPFAAVQVPIAELGWFPARLLASLLVFDWHTHLAHDIAPAIGRPAPALDDLAVAVTLEWMLVVLAQHGGAQHTWMDRSVALRLTGPGGGVWTLAPGAHGRLNVTTDSGHAAATITGSAADFPSWATTRTAWNDHDLTISGDRDYATRFLDGVNII